MSGEQLSRLQQVNRFLEHNLKENGELLSSLATLYEEQRAARARNTQLEEQLGSLAAAPSASADYKAMLGKYLRADSYRKVSKVIERIVFLLYHFSYITSKSVSPAVLCAGAGVAEALPGGAASGERGQQPPPRPRACLHRHQGPRPQTRRQVRYYCH